MGDDDANHVLVRPKRAFAGPPGEAEHTDGVHRPGGRPFRVSRQRRADLMANDLVEDHDPEQPAIVEATAMADDRIDDEVEGDEPAEEARPRRRR